MRHREPGYRCLTHREGPDSAHMSPAPDLARCGPGPPPRRAGNAARTATHVGIDLRRGRV